jgi:ADP-heptose:LPS heptosyltransferase
VTTILIAPFSNSDIRDWPADHYRRLIEILLDCIDDATTIRLVGAKGQVLPACEIVRGFDPDRVVNDCGRHSWHELIDVVRSAACVIGNNSGIVHLAGHHRTPAVCVFSGAHQRIEWRPIAFGVATLSRSIACSPCHLHYAADCPYNLACLRRIEPELVANVALKLMVDRPQDYSGEAVVSATHSLEETMTDA